MDVCNMRQTLLEIKSMISTPIKRFEGSEENQAPTTTPATTTDEADAAESVADGDLPGLITRLMGKSE